MYILPSIDLRNGKVVRLERGQFNSQTVYGDDPVAVARQFINSGVEWIHMVDLDGAKTGQRTNAPAVRSVREAVSAKVQLGGGARSETIIRSMLDDGIDRVVVGSAALKDWKWFENLIADADLAGRIALGLDARAGKLAIHGWVEEIGTTVLDVARRVSGSSLGAIVFTDITRDGMMAGVNADMTERLVSGTDVPIIASGGVGSIEDVRLARSIGCSGVIIGRAYYEGKIDLEEAIATAARPSD